MERGRLVVQLLLMSMQFLAFQCALRSGKGGTLVALFMYWSLLERPKATLAERPRKLSENVVYTERLIEFLRLSVVPFDTARSIETGTP